MRPGPLSHHPSPISIFVFVTSLTLVLKVACSIIFVGEHPWPFVPGAMSASDTFCFLASESDIGSGWDVRFPRHSGSWHMYDVHTDLHVSLDTLL